MQDESLSIVPRDERPVPDELTNYKSVYPDGDPQYDNVRPQLAAWLYDYRRKQDEDRGKEDGREPFEDDAVVQGGRSGYDPESFEGIERAIQRAPATPRR